jgi:hypothetical protein
MTVFTKRYSEKYMKKLIGRVEIEDALMRLDRLTQEEARMATAQSLRVTHTVDMRVNGVADSVAAIDHRVAGIDDQVQQTADDVDEVKRLSSPNLIPADYEALPHPFRESITREHSHMALTTGPFDEP